MASSTTNKKEIVDFLWDWAEANGDWAKLLVQKIIDTECPLEFSEREEIFKYYLESSGLEKGLPSLYFIKPSYTPTDQHIELESLSDVSGVNKLAKNQTIYFAPNITMIYGENGTGKTGYGRILKALGFSYDRNNIIYSDVFGESEPKSAIIKYKINGDADTFVWNGGNRDEDLKNISVFNSDCVKISLDGSRQLIVSPIGFHLFDLVTSELKELDGLLSIKLSDYNTELLWKENLHEGTPQYQFITNLSKDSNKTRLNELSSFASKHEKELKVKETELSKLNKSLLQNEIRLLCSQSDELLKVIDKIEIGQSTFNVQSWKKIIEINKSIAELEKKTHKGIKEIAESNGIQFYESAQFKSFLSAAEAYIKLLNNPKYPENGDICIYCRQPLEQTAKDLLANYRVLLGDQTEEKILKIKKEKQELITKIKNDVDTGLHLNHASFGLDKEEKPIQPQKLKEYNQQLGDLKKRFISDKVAEDSIFNFDYNGYITLLSDKKTQIDESLKYKKELIENLDKKEKELNDEIRELKDRKILSAKKEGVKKAIDNLKTLSVLNKHSNRFNTVSISRKTSQAREELVSQNFNQIFQEELSALRKSNLQIELSFETERGRSKLSHCIGNKQLTEILSEGEQKAIALSEFLTELQLDNVKAPVIFDDPVNSLDHKIIDAVAKRLMRLSNERQVVIFTHSVLLFNSLLYLNSQPSFKVLANNFYNIKNEYDEVGVITEAEEEKNKVKYNITNINKLINNTPKDRFEVDVAKEGYNELRSAIELCVEHEIFEGTVKRYQKNVSLSNFIKVDADKINSHKEALNDIFERCCSFIGSHSNPEVVYNDPTLDDLKCDFEDFKRIRKDFIQNKKNESY